jgi:hypothetical protein
MKITKNELRRIIKEELLDYTNGHNLDEGLFGGALKGMVRKIPGVGDSIADADTSMALDDLDEKLTEMVEKLEELGKRMDALESAGSEADTE